MKRWMAAMTVAAPAVVGGCAERPTGDGRASVAATIFPLGSLTQQIVGADVQVVTLLPPGVSEHVFEPTASQMQAVGEARLVVAVGLGLDHWVHDAMHATGKSDEEMFDAGVALGMGEGEEHHDDDDHEHVEGVVDPHIWLDPVLMRELVPKLAERLKGALPEFAGVIDANAGKVIADIDAIDAMYRARLGRFGGRGIVTYHPAFSRLAERYGLVVAATLHSAGNPGSSPLVNLQQSIEMISKQDLKVIFAEPQFSPDTAELLGRETGVTVLILDPLGDPRAPERDSWQKLMKYNLQMLVKGLSL